MGKVVIQNYTTKEPITMIGYEAGVCWGSDTSNREKNYKRGLDCLNNEHGRTFEFPDIYATLTGYSARTIREWYTHIGCLPTRLQSSTRYINYENFKYVVPPSVKLSPAASIIYNAIMKNIAKSLQMLTKLGIPQEDAAMVLPLAMETNMVDKRNLRNVIDVSHQRMCKRAYHEFRTLFEDYSAALSEYSEEWKYLVDNYFMPKCKYLGKCKEKNGCFSKMMMKKV